MMPWRPPENPWPIYPIAPDVPLVPKPRPSGGATTSSSSGVPLWVIALIAYALTR